MSEFNRENTYGLQSGETLQSYIVKVFAHMGAGLFLTTLVALGGYFFLSANLYSMSGTLFRIITIVSIVAQLGVTVALSAGLFKFSTPVCRTLFLVYCVLTGVTFSVLPFVYGLGTIFTAFLFAAVLFVSCAIIGKTTNVDLTKFSGILMGALIALVLMTIISMFVPALRESLLIGYLGLALFLVLTAFDVQKIKHFYLGSAEGVYRDNLAIYGAFQLYLDFINIFLYILRILGSRRD